MRSPPSNDSSPAPRVRRGSLRRPVPRPRRGSVRSHASLARTSYAQIEAACGRQSQAIVTNHVTKLSFPGMSDAAALDYVSRLLGDEYVPSRLNRTVREDSEGDRVTSVPLVLPLHLPRSPDGGSL